LLNLQGDKTKEKTNYTTAKDATNQTYPEGPSQFTANDGCSISTYTHEACLTKIDNPSTTGENMNAQGNNNTDTHEICQPYKLTGKI
jgi:hypothetical protein